jgi:hypothetical protein
VNSDALNLYDVYAKSADIDRYFLVTVAAAAAAAVAAAAAATTTAAAAAAVAAATAATTTAAAAVTAAAAAATAAAAAAGAGTPLGREVDTDGPTIKVCALGRIFGFVGTAFFSEANESETTGTSSVTICDHLRFGNLSILLEVRAECIITRCPCEATYK